MAEFQVATGAIFYELLDPVGAAGTVEAEAPTLLLIHNFMSSGRSAWGPLVDGLRQRFRVLLPDLPGHGRSLGHPIGFNHTVIARQLAELLQALDVTTAHLAGCSSGGMIAQLLVQHKLVMPPTVTLVSTTHSVDPATNGAASSLQPERFEASPAWLQATARLHDPYRYDGYYEDVLLPGFRALSGGAAIDLPIETLADWSMPVCIIHGAQDEFFPVAIAERMAAVLPDAELAVVPQQSHALLFRRPWLVLEHMLAFYDHRLNSKKG